MRIGKAITAIHFVDGGSVSTEERDEGNEGAGCCAGEKRLCALMRCGDKLPSPTCVALALVLLVTRGCCSKVLGITRQITSHPTHSSDIYELHACHLCGCSEAGTRGIIHGWQGTGRQFVGGEGRRVACQASNCRLTCLGVLVRAVTVSSGNTMHHLSAERASVSKISAFTALSYRSADKCVVALNSLNLITLM